MSDLSEIRKQILKFRDDRNWQQFHQLKDLLLGLQIESAELLVAFYVELIDHKKHDDSKESWLLIPVGSLATTPSTNLRFVRGAHGFASPPLGGFAFIEREHHMLMPGREPTGIEPRLLVPAASMRRDKSWYHSSLAYFPRASPS